MTEQPRKPGRARKKPSSAKPPKAAELIRSAERALAADIGVKRTTDQHLARAALHTELRDNPQLRVDSLNATVLASVCRDRRVVGWCRDPEFRRWLLHGRDTEIRVEAAYSQFVEGLEFRRVGMSDKDYINTIKLLAELANKMPKKWENTRVLDADVGKMTGDAQTQLLVDTLRRMGYSVTAGTGPTAGLPDSASPEEATQPGPSPAPEPPIFDSTDADALSSTLLDPED